MRLQSIILYAFFFLLIHSISVAQVEKGRLRLGGEISGFLQKNKQEVDLSGLSTEYEISHTFISFSPVGGLFLLDGFELGISPSINWNKYSVEDSYDTKSIDYLIGPYTNYYFGSGEKGKPFVGFNPKIGWGKNKLKTFDMLTGEPRTSERTSKILSVSITAGYALFLNDSYLLSFFAGYDYSDTKYNDEDSEYSITDKASMFKLGVSISTTFKR